MRGKRRAVHNQGDSRRITPAGAGKTQPQSGIVWVDRDHPRRCGENFNRFQCFKFHIGSPPQVRGKQSALKNICQINRITPAGAGKTVPACNRPSRAEDHPRRCGENFSYRCILLITIGSPPQVRGKRGRPRHGRCPLRITPAGAGKTPYDILQETAAEDHPRRCGENDADSIRAIGKIGSPPQVRGKLRER